MNIVKVLVVILVVLLGFGCILGGCVVSGYNRALTLDESVTSNWKEIENQLQRRFDLIPNLVETVKGITGQEEKIFLGIAKSREAYFQKVKSDAPIEERAQAARKVESGLSRLLLLQERYPVLRSSENFLKLQDSVEGTENRLAVARKRYNETVEALNRFVRKFPSSFYASLADVDKAEYFEVSAEARERPDIDFSGEG